MMIKHCALMLVVGTLLTTPALAEPVSPKIELKLGALHNPTSTGRDKEIVFEVKNGTDSFLTYVSVSCGFYSADGKLVHTGGSLVHRINPGETATGSAGAEEAPDAVRASCRIDNVKK
jgi:hypothetical protein